MTEGIPYGWLCPLLRWHLLVQMNAGHKTDGDWKQEAYQAVVKEFMQHGNFVSQSLMSGIDIRLGRNIMLLHIEGIYGNSCVPKT